LNPYNIVLFGITCLASSSALAAAPTAAPACAYHYFSQTATIAGHDTTVEYYKPDGPGPFPLVYMLHGSAGAFTLRSAGEPTTDNFGEKTLARNCFAVVLPHYLEALGFKSITSKAEMAARFPAMLAAVESLLDGAETLPWVKGKPVFIFGESLGGYLGIALSFRRSEVSAVSEFSGGLPAGYSLNRSHLPGVLISHGEADTLVPVSEADALKRYCTENGVPVEINLYRAEGHYLSPATQATVLSRTIEFFRTQASGVNGYRTGNPSK
jgi:dienelactone hydrolase